MILGAAGILVVTLTGSTSVHVQGTAIRVSDVATVGRGAPAAVLETVVARLPEGSVQRVSRPRLAALLRHALPASRVDAVEGADIVISSTAHREQPAPRCLEAAADIAEHARVESGAIRRVDCDRRRRPAAVITDQDHATAMAAAPIHRGDYLGQLSMPDPRVTPRGAKLTLVSRSGPVTIRRGLISLQALRPGQHRLFVRTADGTVFSAPVSKDLAE